MTISFSKAKPKPRIVDLPEQFGERMRLDNVRALFADHKNRELCNAFAQLLWMHRRRADEDARNAAVKGTGSPAFHLGEMDVMDAALADLQNLTTPGSGVDEQIKAWFRE